MNFRKDLYALCGGPKLRGEEKRGGSKSVDEADYHRYYDGRDLSGIAEARNGKYAPL